MQLRYNEVWVFHRSKQEMLFATMQHSVNAHVTCNDAGTN